MDRRSLEIEELASDVFNLCLVLLCTDTRDPSKIRSNYLLKGRVNLPSLEISFRKSLYSSCSKGRSCPSSHRSNSEELETVELILKLGWRLALLE